MKKLLNESALKSLIPPNSLTRDNLRKLAAQTVVEDVAPGGVIFTKGDTNHKTIYLLTGAVQLTDRQGNTSHVKAGSDAAKHPISSNQDSAVSKVASKIARVDSKLLDILLIGDQVSGIKVDEIAAEKDIEPDTGTGDWMARILQSQAFLQIPPANIQALFLRVQEVPVKAGEVIIRQGDEGDYYYIIKRGQCKVTRMNNVGAELILNRLSVGDAFGEDALISNDKRTANVVMTSDGALMRLSKRDFIQLLKEPTLKWVTIGEANKLVKRGAVWIDVRLESEHKNSKLLKSINIPLFMLRLKAPSLDPSKKYILYCDTGRRAAAGAFTLSAQGLDAYCLKV